MTVSVRKVENTTDFKLFFEFPWQHYKDHPHWIPELPAIRRAALDKKKHPAWQYMAGDYFLAWRDGQVVGQIAAFVNHRHNEFHDENVGFFGFFECIDDQATADALLNTAADYLRGMGVDAVRGPASFNSNEQWGLLVDSFDKDPMLLMPYNPAYYVRLIENAGFYKAMDLYSWRGDFPEARLNVYEKEDTEKRLVRAIRRGMERHGITVRNLDMRNKKRDFGIFRQLYDKAWEKNWGFIPMTDRELDNLINDLGFLVLPKYTWLAFVKGEPAGFLLLIPNFNEVMKHVKPHPGLPMIWWLLKSAWHWKLRPKITSLRVILLGVKEEFRGMGVDAAVLLALAEQMIADEHRYEWAEASWILENNEATNGLLEHFGSRMHRRHRLYEKALK